MTPPPAASRIGIVITGVDTERDFHFYVTAGIDLELESLSFLSATGAPDPEEFATINPRYEPKKFRKKIIDTKFELARDKKEFYTQTVEEEFRRIFNENLGRINELFNLDSPEEELKKLLSGGIDEFRASDLNLELVDFDALEFDEDQDLNLEETETEQFDSEIDDEVTLKTVIPLIDIENGVAVETLEPGTEIAVKLPLRSRGSDHDDIDNSVIATFLEFSADGDDGNGSVLVQIDEDVMGKGTVSKGSLVKLAVEHERNQFAEYAKDLFTYILVFAGIVLAVIISIALFTFG